MESIEKLGIIILGLLILFFFIKFLEDLFIKPRKKSKRRKRKKVFLTARTKAKAERKYRKILAEFKRKYKRKPTKKDLRRVVITASHHTYPTKGRNSRRWMRRKRGHWNRQKVRKYLLAKHNIDKNYRMK